MLKNRFSFFYFTRTIVIAFVLIGSFIFFNVCNNPIDKQEPEDGEPVVNSVEITTEGNAVSVKKGASLQFSASVVVENGAAETVSWSVISIGHHADTVISSSGLLTVSVDEPKTSLTVKAAPTQTGFENFASYKNVEVTQDAVSGNSIYRIYNDGYQGGAAAAPWDNAGAALSEADGQGRSGGKAVKISRTIPAVSFGFTIKMPNAGKIDFNSEANALSFWVRGSAAMVIDKAGFDNEGPYHIQYMGEDKNGIVVTTEWKRVVIPIPAKRAAGTLNAFYLSAGQSIIGNDLFIDDIEFIKASVNITRIRINETAGPVSHTANTPADTLTGDKFAVYSIDGQSSTLYDYIDLDGTSPLAVNKFSSWYTFTYAVSGGAVLQNGNEIKPNVPGGSFTMTLSFGGAVSNVLSAAIDEEIVIVDPDNPVVDGIKIGDTVAGKGVLVWRDEFNGTALDNSKWNYDYGAGGQYDSNLWGWGNGERQWYKPENVRVSGGTLIIESKKDAPDINYPYSSGKITTKGTLGSTGQSGVSNNQHMPAKDFLGVTQGFVEAKIKTPKGVGFWPAFWMLSANCDSYSGYPLLGWPACGEIDILETVGGEETTMHQTIHFGSVPFNNATKWSDGAAYQISPGAGDAYHIYGVEWRGSGNTGFLKFYFNGEVKKTINFPLLGGHPPANSESFFNDVPWVIILNLAVGGDMGGGLPTDASMTSGNWEARSLMVDWVRVYE